MTTVLRVDPDRPADDVIARAAACLRAGGLVAFPTETVYGLGAHAMDRDAVTRVFAAKGRPPEDPLIVHVAGVEDVSALAAGVPPALASLARRFWPGPLTVIVRRAAAVPPEVTAGLETVAVRVPAHPVARALLAAAGLPVAAPSANRFGRTSPTRADHVLADLDGRVDLVLDAGSTDIGVESTVVDLTVTPPVVLRPGAVSLEALQDVVADVRMRTAGAQPLGHPLVSPGLLASHYAPVAAMTLCAGPADAAGPALLREVHAALAEGRRVGVLGTHDRVAAVAGLPVAIADLGPADDDGRIARRLYEALRELDAAGVDLIVAEDLESDAGLRRAIRDRLRRAASRVVEPAVRRGDGDGERER